MTQRDHLVEQHILLHESHLKHIDEMLQQARRHVEAGTAPPEAETELSEIVSERRKLARELSKMKRKSPEEMDSDLVGKGGPLGLWYAVAQRLEKLVERLD